MGRGEREGGEGEGGRDRRIKYTIERFTIVYDSHSTVHTHYTHIHTHTYTHIHTHIHTHYTHIHTHTYTHIHTHTNTHTHYTVYLLTEDNCSCYHCQNRPRLYPQQMQEESYKRNSQNAEP